MIRVTFVTFAIFVSSIGFARDAAASPTPPALQFLVGDWTCFGTYETTPVTVGHTVSAAFRVAPSVGGTWVTGAYDEYASSNGVLLSLADSFALDPFVPGAGLRTFIDSQSGQFRGGFSIVGGTLEFTGDYLFGHQAIPYSETLRHDGDSVFTTEARVNLGFGFIVFHRQRCIRGQ